MVGLHSSPSVCMGTYAPSHNTVGAGGGAGVGPAAKIVSTPCAIGPDTARPGGCRSREPGARRPRRRSATRLVVARNLVNLKSVAKGYASRSVLDDVTLGVSEGDRIGIVGTNGAGKSTLLRLIAGSE